MNVSLCLPWAAAAPELRESSASCNWRKALKPALSRLRCGKILSYLAWWTHDSWFLNLTCVSAAAHPEPSPHCLQTFLPLPALANELPLGQTLHQSALLSHSGGFPQSKGRKAAPSIALSCSLGPEGAGFNCISTQLHISRMIPLPKCFGNH